LGTADLRTANEKAKALQAEWAQKFDVLRSGKPAPVDLPRIRNTLFERLESMIKIVDNQYGDLVGEARTERAQELKWQLDEARAGLREGIVPDWVESSIVGLGLPRSPLVDAEVQAHIVTMLEIRHEALVDETRTFPLRVSILNARKRLIATFASTSASAEAIQSTSTRVNTGHKISDALELWKSIQRPEKTVGAFSRHAQQFADMMGDPFLESIDKTAAIEFRDKLQQWAVENRKTSSTADNVLVSIRALVNVARDKGWIPGNPFERLTVKVGGKESEGREPWTHSELKTLFDDPIWAAGKLPKDRKAGGAAAYWIPLIACYTGARVTEIAQLWTDDLDITPGQEVIEFRPDAERGQKLKNKGSWRAVPMHSELVRLGLPEYVKSLPEGHLFPLLPRNGQNGAGGQFSQWFGDFKRNKGFGSPSKSMHSFRHLVASELRLAKVTDPMAGAITGHAGTGIGRTRYAATIRREAERLRPEIERLAYPGLTLILPVVRKPHDPEQE